MRVLRLFVGMHLILSDHSLQPKMACIQFRQFVSCFVGEPCAILSASIFIHSLMLWMYVVLVVFQNSSSNELDHRIFSSAAGIAIANGALELSLCVPVIL